MRQKLKDIKLELFDVKKKNENMEKEMKKMGELYDWYEKQKGLTVSLFF